MMPIRNQYCRTHRRRKFSIERGFELAISRTICRPRRLSTEQGLAFVDELSSEKAVA